jgi:hypothetical protein
VSMATRPKKARTPAEVRDRRGKIVAAVLGVVFLGVAAIQGPKLMKQLKGGGSSSAPTPVAVAAPSSAPGVSAAVAMTASTGHLTRFTLFAAKDPFKALVTAGAAQGATATTSKLAGTTTTGQAAGTTASATFTQTPARTRRTVPAALILLNGKRHVVALGFAFPARAPLFRLVSLGVKLVRVGLVGGTFANGRSTLPLRQGEKVTLANSTTGAHYVLRLVRLTATPAPLPTTKTGASPTTPAGTATTTTSTTPASTSG